MDKWEYKITKLIKGFRQKTTVENWKVELDELGKEGWKLVSATLLHAQMGMIGSTMEVICFLKRNI